MFQRRLRLRHHQEVIDCEITLKDGSLSVASPYDEEFVRLLKMPFQRMSADGIQREGHGLLQFVMEKLYRIFATKYLISRLHCLSWSMSVQILLKEFWRCVILVQPKIVVMEKVLLMAGLMRDGMSSFLNPFYVHGLMCHPSQTNMLRCILF